MIFGRMSLIQHTDTQQQTFSTMIKSRTVFKQNDKLTKVFQSGKYCSADCHYSESLLLYVVLPNVIVQNVDILSVIILSVIVLKHL